MTDTSPNQQLRVCVVTGTRAEFGLLQWVMRALLGSVDFELQVIATGMHLSPEFGLTYRDIEAAGFSIDRKVEMLLSSDSAAGIAKSIGLGVIGFADAFTELKPDLVFVLGDRFEILAAATAATCARIPVAHAHGGETTEGAFDEAFRHSITKMSHLHFTSTEAYRQRVIQLGEAPNRVFNVGALGIENIHKMTLLNRDALAQSLNFPLGDAFALVTFHPVTLENQSAATQMAALTAALDHFPNLKVVLTKANADTDGRIINQMADDYARAHPDRVAVFASLGQLRYLSALGQAAVVVGNSSSGLIEAPSFGVPTLNIGDRQRGRIAGDSVINCPPTVEGITHALHHALSPGFQAIARAAKNPYDAGCASDAILAVLRATSLEDILKKTFHDLPTA